jgi:hypothetical protein
MTSACAVGRHDRQFAPRLLVAWSSIRVGIAI